jgi:adenylate cyclase
VERRLAAILAADVVGYSRLMGEDEAGTLERLKSLRRELVQPKIAGSRGRIVKLMGDGLLAEFPSVVEAVQCAVDIQQDMASREADLPAERRIRLRVGVNLGDIIVEGSDIYGDGVNVAARLEGLAEPDGICISGKVYEEVGSKLPTAFEDLGEQEVKNIRKPVRVYRWTDAAADPVPGAAGAEGALPLPDKPSIAVLPFTNMSGDPEQEYFSDGITEDIITELSRFRSLFVIARNSSFHYKGQSPKIQDVGRELGVRYVVEGSVRKAGNRVRVTAQLVEAASGNHLWAERYDRDLEDIFAVQDELVRTIASTVGGRVDSASEARAERMSESDLLAYDHVLRASAAGYRHNKEDNRQAGLHARQAVELDPQSAQAHSMLAEVRFVDWMAHWVEDRESSLLSAFESAKRAAILDKSSSAALATLGQIQVFRREYEDARHSLERAIMLNPNDAQVLAYYGMYLTAVGRVAEALAQYELSERINPLHRDLVDWLKGIALFTARRYDEATTTLRSIKDPINEVRGWLAASYAGAGRLEEARATLEEFLRVAEEDMAIFPGRKLAAWEDYWHGAMEYQDNADFEHLYEALRKAGLED